MYPYLRLASLFFRGIFAKKKPFQPLETQAWSFRPGIGDIDVYFEINNGRHFVFFDLARYDLAIRMGLYKWVRKTKSAFVVAGSSIRYMHRVKPWRKSKVKTKLVGMDEHFFYFHQEIWQRNKKCSSALIRTGVRKKGAIPTKEVMTAMNLNIDQFMEEWVKQWAKWDDLYRSEK